MIMEQSDSVTLTVRSFLFPDEPQAGFEPGRPFTLNVPLGTTVEQLLARLYLKKSDQIGVTALNGKLASGETILSSGDAIDFYPLLDGG